MIENQESVRAYVADLIDISGMSQSAVAGKAGVFRGNLQKWLRGQGQSLGPPGVSKVLSVLGVESGHLSSAVVHFFSFFWMIRRTSPGVSPLSSHVETTSAQVGSFFPGKRIAS